MTKTFRLLSCSALALVAAPFQVAAQPAAGHAVAPASSVEPRGDELSEVVVTATRRDTKLEQTPVAITAFSGAAIDSQRLYNLADVAQKTPGLVFTPFSRQESYISIRGTTINNDAPGSNLGVSVFIDDVPTTGIGDNNPDLFDLQSIEVLRGPQGTLFGQNVTGGAIVINTSKPEFTEHESLQATYGNFNLGEIRAFVTGPLVDDKLAGKITIEGRRQDGLLSNTDLHDRALSTEDWAVRSQLLWTPTSRLKVLVGVDFNSDTSPYKAQQLIGNFQPAVLPALSYSPNDVNQGIDSKGAARTGGALARVDYETAIGVLSSISGLRYVNDRAYFSTSGEPNNEILQHVQNKDTQITEELRIASPVDQRLTWVGGFFFLNANRKLDKSYDLNVTPGTLLSFVPPYSALQFQATQNQSILWHSYAVFGEANYDFTPKLKLTVGARYTEEDKSGHSEVTDTSGLSPVLVTPRYTHSWSGFTPKATLTYQPNLHVLTYATFAEGFKSGGFDLSGTTIPGLETPFRPERVKSYELGFKVSALRNRLVVNVAGFYADYTDLQVQQYDPSLLQFVTANAGRSRIPGAEVDTEFSPTKWLSFRGSYSYADSHYSQYVTPGNDYSGNQIPFSAKSHGDIGADVHFVSDRLAGGEVRLGGDVSFQSRRFFTDDNSDPSFVERKTIVDGLFNMRASWTSRDEHLSVSLWGKNITNQRSLIFGTDVTPFYANPPEYFGGRDKIYGTDWTPPPTVGFTVAYKR